MFEQSFTGTGKTNKSWSVFLSFGAQMLVIILAILIPLIYTDTLPRAQLTSFLVAPPPPPPPPPASPTAPSPAPRAAQGGQDHPASIRRRQTDGSQDHPQRHCQH